MLMSAVFVNKKRKIVSQTPIDFEQSSHPIPRGARTLALNPNVKQFVRYSETFSDGRVKYLFFPVSGNELMIQRLAKFAMDNERFSIDPNYIYTESEVRAICREDERNKRGDYKLTHFVLKKLPKDFSATLIENMKILDLFVEQKSTPRIQTVMTEFLIKKPKLDDMTKCSSDKASCSEVRANYKTEES